MNCKDAKTLRIFGLQEFRLKNEHLCCHNAVFTDFNALRLCVFAVYELFRFDKKL